MFLKIYTYLTVTHLTENIHKKLRVLLINEVFFSQITICFSEFTYIHQGEREQYSAFDSFLLISSLLTLMPILILRNV